MHPVGGTLSRRTALRILAVSGTAAAAWAVGRRGIGAAHPVTRTRVLMGTGTTVTVVAEDAAAAAAAADAMLDGMAADEALLSAYRPDSEISRLNASGRLAHPAPVVTAVLQRAAEAAWLGDGAFDVTVQPLLALYRDPGRPAGALPPPAALEQARAAVDHRHVRLGADAITLARPEVRVTVDGIATGAIVDRGVATLRRHGFDNVLVDAGGDLMLSGERAAGVPWRVGIRNPRPGIAILARLETCNRAVATSGDYMQPFTPDYAQHHILDPRTGTSPPELASVTVLAPDALAADTFSTLTMVLGARRGRELLEALPDCEGYFVAKDGTITRTSGFPLV